MAEKLVRLEKTTFFPYSSVSTPRLIARTALDRSAVEQGLAPNTIAKINLSEGAWRVVAVLSPYTQKGCHVMLVDDSDKYKPDPTQRHVSKNEGNNLMKLWRQITNFQRQMPGTKSINVGWNYSPTAYGTDEERGGWQTLTTKWHPQLWNFVGDQELVPLDSELIAEGTRRVLKGNKLNEFFGLIVKDYILKNIPRSENFLVLSTTRVDYKGLEVDLKDNLSQTLEKEGFFSDFLQTIASGLDRVAQDVIDATSTFDRLDFMDCVRQSFEIYPDGHYSSLQEREMELRPKEERKNRLMELEKKGYPDHIISKLLALNRYLRGKSEVPVNERFRKGFGYALVLSEELNSDGMPNRTFLRITPGIYVEDRGGVVEALGIALRRQESVDPFQAEKDNEKREVLRRLGEYLQNN